MKNLPTLLIFLKKRNNTLPKIVHPTLKTHDLPTTSQPTSVQPPISSYVLQTVNPNVCVTSFSCPAGTIVTEILGLLRPHIELVPSRDSSH